MNNAMNYYFAYGSNLHPLRLRERVPSAEFVSVAGYQGHRIVFEKRGRDGSGKCTLVYTDCGEDIAYGAIYTLDPEHKPILDRYEGPGYRERQITVDCDGSIFTCFTYIARQSHRSNNLMPYHWYKQLVMAGARYHRFPEYYISALESIDSIEDPDENRRRKHAVLVENIRLHG